MIAALFSAAFLVAQYFQFVLGDSPLTAGLHVLPWTAGVMVIAPAAGMLSDRVGQRPVMATRMLVQAAGLGWFAAIATTTTRYGALVPPLILTGIGISLAIPSTTAAALDAATPSEVGKASGANSTMQRFGAVFGVAIVESVLAAGGHLGSATSFTAGFRPALAVAAGLSLLGAATALAVGARRQVGAQDWPILAIAPADAI